MIGGVLSKGSGRLGGYVLAVANGQQIIREYQPNVANPRTSLQRIQRAKMVLAGKLSQITADDYIIGMAPSKRDRRSEYVRNIIKVAQVTETNGEYEASIQYADLILERCSGFLPRGGHHLVGYQRSHRPALLGRECGRRDGRRSQVRHVDQALCVHG